MSGKRTPLSKTTEIKRLIGLGIENRVIARALNVSRNTVKRMREGDVEVAPKFSGREGSSWVSAVPWAQVNQEALEGVALSVLWQEQVENGRVHVQYPAFWKQFIKRYPGTKVTMHRVFAPGSRAEIDYCDGIDFFEPISGEVVSTQLFVGVLCHSRYTFAEFSLSQKSQDFLGSHVRMFEYFGGAPELLSPDNLKSAVTKTHRYDPQINPAYTKLAEHYDVAVVPARVRSPKDKAIVERSIQIFQRWFYAKIRKRTFTSLVELNNCLKEHLKEFNSKKHRIFRASRAELFKRESDALRPLPAQSYEVTTYSQARLHPDCHFAFEKNFYSAPEALRSKLLDIWAGEKTIEVFHQGVRVAVHKRSAGHGLFTTNKAHYPEAHRAYAEAIPEKLRAEAAAVGKATENLISQMLSGANPLRHLRRAQGVIGLTKECNRLQMEEACAAALRLNQINYRFVDSYITRRQGGPQKEKGTDPRTGQIQRGENPLLRQETLFH